MSNLFFKIKLFYYGIIGQFFPIYVYWKLFDIHKELEKEKNALRKKAEELNKSLAP